MHLDPRFVDSLKAKQAAWNAERAEPWSPSQAAEDIANTVRDSCSRMAGLLDDYGLLEVWAEDLQHRILATAAGNWRAGLDDKDAIAEARSLLIPTTWAAQEDWLLASCVNFEPTPYFPTSGEEEDEESELDCPYPCFYLRPDDREIISKLQQIVVLAIRRPDLDGRVIARLGCIKWLLDELPALHPKWFGVLTFSTDYETGMALRTISISDEGLSVDVGEIIRDTYGSDYSSTVVFKAGEEKTDHFKCDDWEDWISTFRRDAADPDVSIQLEWHPDDVLPPL